MPLLSPRRFKSVYQVITERKRFLLWLWRIVDRRCRVACAAYKTNEDALHQRRIYSVHSSTVSVGIFNASEKMSSETHYAPLNPMKETPSSDGDGDYPPSQGLMADNMQPKYGREDSPAGKDGEGSIEEEEAYVDKVCVVLHEDSVNLLTSLLLNRSPSGVQWS